MRISDWSSDVCSSDLLVRIARGQGDPRALPREAPCHGGAEACPRADDEHSLRHRPSLLAPGPVGRRGGNHSRRGSRQRKADVEAIAGGMRIGTHDVRSEEHTSELQSLMRISYAVFCLKKKTTKTNK